jgi:hypothetical protein
MIFTTYPVLTNPELWKRCNNCLVHRLIEGGVTTKGKFRCAKCVKLRREAMIQIKERKNAKVGQ